MSEEVKDTDGPAQAQQAAEQSTSLMDVQSLSGLAALAEGPVTLPDGEEIEIDPEFDMKQLKDFLKRQKPGFKLLLKQGSKGSQLLWLEDGETDEFGIVDNQSLVKIPMPACKFSNYPDLSLVDTTGAGDTFTAGFAVALGELQQNKTKD